VTNLRHVYMTITITGSLAGTMQNLLKDRAGGKQGRAFPSTSFSNLKGRAFTFLCNN
jgi:hypothetical protein